MASSQPHPNPLTSPSHACWWQEAKEARPIYVQGHLISPRLPLLSSTSASKSSLSHCSPAPAWRPSQPRSPREEDGSTFAMAVAISGGLTSSLAMLEEIMRDTQTSLDSSRDMQQAADEQRRLLLSMKKRLQAAAQPKQEEGTEKFAELQRELGACRSELSRCRQDLTLQLALSERISRELEETQTEAEEMRATVRERDLEIRELKLRLEHTKENNNGNVKEAKGSQREEQEHGRQGSGAAATRRRRERRQDATEVAKMRDRFREVSASLVSLQNILDLRLQNVLPPLPVLLLSPATGGGRTARGVCVETRPPLLATSEEDADGPTG
eukprot:767034-Hanusia_phi.AAC.2